MSEGIIKNELNPGEKRGSARFLLFSGGIPGVSGHLPPLWKQNDTIRVPKTGLSNVKMGLNASTKSAKIKKRKLLRRFQRSNLNGGSVSPDLSPSIIFMERGWRVMDILALLLELVDVIVAIASLLYQWYRDQ